MDIFNVLTKELNIQRWQTEAVIRLIDEGNTIPFIARYRKEATGALNDEILRSFDERLRYLRNLEERKKTILSTIEEQGNLTEELRRQISDAETMVALEDVYRPYKPKRRTRAMVAREKGLAPLANALRLGCADPEKEAEKFVDPEKEIPDAGSALSMAEDILAEQISDDADYRKAIRTMTYRSGLLTSRAKEKEPDPQSVYANYYDYSEALKKIPGHRILAINRGEKEKVLSVGIAAPVEDILSFLSEQMQARRNPACTPYLEEAISDAYKRLIAPSIETELRNSLTEEAENSAITVFGTNLTQLLMQPPVQGKTVLGWDPAFRTGCKLAVVDPTGKVLDTVVIYPTAPQNRVEESKRTLSHLVDRYQVDLISVGNGTASRESEAVIAEYIRECSRPLQYVIVNEAGASVYSASKLATEEFPDFDVGQRSAASIARRLQDPLAELVKIDPKAIGVGQYQHDMNQTKLGEALSAVVEDCVNRVGVDINTASAALLEYVSGINHTIARNIVSYREEHGAFTSRRELLKVPKLGPKAYEQCAGFLRIRSGKEALDNTGVHPESYPETKKLLRTLGFTDSDIQNGSTRSIRGKVQSYGASRLAEETGLGKYTLQDILTELEKPGRDPREQLQAPILRSDVLDFKDLKPDMILKGTVRNVIDFGAFVDIGVHQDGLVHISELSDRYVKHPLDVVHVGDVVEVRILSVDEKRKRISLSMKGLN